MLKLHLSSCESSSADSVGEIFPGLSTRWLLLDWSQMEPAHRHTAKRLVVIGAAQVRLRCTIRKDGMQTPLLATIAAAGDYWRALEAKLEFLAKAAIPWKHRPGTVHFKAAKVGLRLTDAGNIINGAAKSPAGEAAGVELEVEECQFADGTPFPGGTSTPADPMCEADVSWSLGNSAERCTMALGTAGVQARLDCTPPSKRSWTQDELDIAIGAYRDDPANEFSLLRDLIQSGCPKAYAKAKGIFGRNAVVRNLGVRGAAMVSRSPIWQALAAELDLPRGKGKPLPLRSYALVPMDDALEELADAQGGSVLDDLVVVETREQFELLVRHAKLRFARHADATQFTKMVDAIRVVLDNGKLAPENAIALVELAIEQVKDNRKRLLRPQP